MTDCGCNLSKGVQCAWHALKASGLSAESWLEQAGVDMEQASGCGYCDGYCVHDVAGESEGGLRLVQSQLMDMGIPPRDDIVVDSSWWTPWADNTRQPSELPVYTIDNGVKRFKSGPRGGTSERTKARTGVARLTRSNAGQMFAAWKRTGTCPVCNVGNADMAHLEAHK